MTLILGVVHILSLHAARRNPLFTILLRELRNTMAGSNRVDIKRTRIHIEASGASPGSHGSRRFPEKLVDKSRRITSHGTADVDDGASITTGLAQVVSQKACQLGMRLKSTLTGQLTAPSGVRLD